MSASFHVDAGAFSVRVELDDSGIHFSRQALGRTHAESIAWEKITAATLVLPAAGDSADRQNEEQAAKFLGAQAVARLHELEGTVGEIFLAYRDDQNRLRQGDVPAPLSDPAYLGEFKTRLGARWLGESKDQQAAEKKLHTRPGFFKTVFLLVALVGIVAVVAALALAGLAGPILNLLSIQKMLLDLQDGNLPGFAYRLASYAALFILGYLLHRVIRSRLDAMKRPRSRGLSARP